MQNAQISLPYAFKQFEYQRTWYRFRKSNLSISSYTAMDFVSAQNKSLKLKLAARFYIHSVSFHSPVFVNMFHNDRIFRMDKAILPIWHQNLDAIFLKFELNGSWKEAAHLRWYKPFFTVLKHKMLKCVFADHQNFKLSCMLWKTFCIPKFLAVCFRYFAFKFISWVIASWFLRVLPNPDCSQIERHILGTLAAFQI